jgi:hypothetical protein
LRIILIHAGNVTAELRSAISAGSTRIFAQAKARAPKYSIDLTKRDRC